MKTLTTKIARFIIIGTVLTASAAYAEESSQQEQVIATENQLVTEMIEVNVNLVQDFQQQLTNSIKQQVNSTLNIITKSVQEALLP
jgi:hypothetical protein